MYTYYKYTDKLVGSNILKPILGLHNLRIWSPGASFVQTGAAPKQVGDLKQFGFHLFCRWDAFFGTFAGKTGKTSNFAASSPPSVAIILL